MSNNKFYDPSLGAPDVEDYGNAFYEKPVHNTYPVSSFILGATGGALLSTATLAAQSTAVAFMVGCAPLTLGLAGIAAVGVAVYLVMPERMTVKDYVIVGVGVTSAAVLGTMLSPVAFGVATGTATFAVVNRIIFSNTVMTAVVAGGIAFYSDSNGVLKEVSPAIAGVASGAAIATVVGSAVIADHQLKRKLQEAENNFKRADTSLEYYEQEFFSAKVDPREEAQRLAAFDTVTTADHMRSANWKETQVQFRDYSGNARAMLDVVGRVQKNGMGMARVEKHLTDAQIAASRAVVAAHDYGGFVKPGNPVVWFDHHCFAPDNYADQFTAGEV
jgi:hypothetical protein